jgi:hypothetical protein
VGIHVCSHLIEICLDLLSEYLEFFEASFIFPLSCYLFLQLYNPIILLFIFANQILRFCSVAMKAVIADVIESGSFLTSSITRVSMTTYKGSLPVTRSFLVCHSTIMQVALSNHNFFRFSTLLGLDGV